MNSGLRQCAILLLVSLLDAGGSIAQAQQPPGARATSGKPNIVLFLIDDLGWADLGLTGSGLTGSTFYETPRVDALAEEGVFFSDAYAASPVCSPTRASIQTGKYPSRIKMSYLAGSRGPMGPDRRLTPPEVAGNMPHDDTTLAEALEVAGYTTAHVGKWHLQAHARQGRANFPEKHGFDVNIAGHNAGQPGSYYFPYRSEKHSWSNVPDLENGKEGDYLTDVLTDRAIEFIKQNRDGPFYLNMWYYTVHTPIQPRNDKLEKYRRKARALGLEKTNREAVPDHQSFSHAHQDNPTYAAMVESMDENIGRILDALNRLNLEKETIVVFFSDNGGLSTGSGKMMPTSNLPLRAGKAWVYEGGIRVPLIIKVPGMGKPGRKIDHPVVSTDIYPTILELAGLPLNPQQHIDGVSLKPLLAGETESLGREAIYFHLPHYHHINTMGPAGAVRRGDFKLVEVFETGKVELYNLRHDIGESNDLSADMPDRAARLKQLLHDWRKESGAAMPARNPAYIGEGKTRRVTPTENLHASTRLADQVARKIADDSPAATQETLPPLTGRVAPQTLDEMWKDFDPRAEPLDVEVLKEWEEDGVVLRVLRYRIGVFKGRPAMMAAVYGYPRGGQKLPGLVQIHGGGQYADYRAVLANARRGYATISIAWAGRISAPDYRVTPREVKLFWENKTDDPAYRLTTDWGALDGYHAPSKHNGPNAFVSIPTAEWTLDAVASPRNNSWFLCALAARRALTFLEQQPEVDGAKLGVYGHSMGGKLTVLTAGADARVKAAAPSCGGISDRYNKNALHRNTVGDAPNLGRISCPIVFLSPANDFHGHINNLITAVDEIQTPDWRVTCSAHLNHQDLPEYEVATQLWFDQYLRECFTWPATPDTSLKLDTEHGMPVFSVRPDMSRRVLGVDVFYCQQGHDDGEGRHHENRIARFWHHTAATQRGDTWVADLPLFSTDKPLWVYANVFYPLDEPIAAAGYYYGSYTTDTFNLSSLIKIVSPEDLQTAGVKAVLKPSLMIETFEGDWKKEWFTTNPSHWAIKTHKVYHPRWAAAEGAKLSFEVRSEQANRLVVGIDGYGAEVRVTGGGEWQSVTLSASDFKSANNEPRSGWAGIKELRLLDTEQLKSKKPGDKAMRRVGVPWKGGAPTFRNLRWSTAGGIGK